MIGLSASTVEQADVERLGEDIRKLYVALTRGRYATLVGVDTFKDWHLSGLAYLLDTNAENPCQPCPALCPGVPGYRRSAHA